MPSACMRWPGMGIPPTRGAHGARLDGAEEEEREVVEEEVFQWEQAPQAL
jgi:hypothetical protein